MGEHLHINVLNAGVIVCKEHTLAFHFSTRAALSFEYVKAEKRR